MVGTSRRQRQGQGYIAEGTSYPRQVEAHLAEATMAAREGNLPALVFPLERHMAMRIQARQRWQILRAATRVLFLVRRRGTQRPPRGLSSPRRLAGGLSTGAEFLLEDGGYGLKMELFQRLLTKP